MYTDQWKQEDGGYLDENDCWYETALDLIGSWLGFCGCGLPKDALDYVKQVLQLIDDRTEGSFERMETFFHSTGETYLVYYLLSDKGLTEHGGAIPGWLTERGKGVLADLTELLP